MTDAIARVGRLVCSLALLIGCSGRADKPAVDSNSNWLSACEVSADCGGDGSCICGLCTRTCSEDAQCKVAGASASCIEPTAASDDVACAALVTSAQQQLCLGECSDDHDCKTGTHCREHACWPAPTGLVDVRDAGPGVSGGQTGTTSGEPGSVRIPPITEPSDFSAPVVQPPPETGITGADAPALVGVWHEVRTTVDMFYDLTLRLDIVETEPGRYAGTLLFECARPRCVGPLGPPPPPTDPEQGYPPDLPPLQQDLLRTNPLPETPYRMLDARAEGGRLSFHFSNNDLWRDWCALQTSYATDVTGRTEHACTPDARPCAEVDDQAAMLPDDSTEIDAKALLCCAGGGVCHCDAERCDAYVQGALHSVDLTIEGDTMRGIATFGTDVYGFVLQRAQVAR